jgi:hypothetical protein
VAAFAFADVLVGDAHPAVALGLRDHRFDEPAVCLLRVGPSRQLVLSLAQAYDQGVAHSLKLPRAEDAGPAHGTDAPFDAMPRECGRKELTELSLERGDLAAEVVADEPLRDDGRNRGTTGGAGQRGHRKRCPRPCLVVLAKLRHTAPSAGG